ncbi:MAG TPA: hypothetical protein VK464_05475 [Symbiobacteriaceae bacterium]|nr:hypothetical protein [Symbiobacteriaceae bacterium]
MLPQRLGTKRNPHPTRTAVDAKLMERTALDEFTLRRVRKEFMRRADKLTYADKRALAEGGTCPRFRLMITVLRESWDETCWTAWLRYLEHSDQDIDEMCRGEYPISPYLIRVFSALFGIKVDFLLLGSAPSVDKVGANIDVWPLTGIR